jgi:hypothetical protein
MWDMFGNIWLDVGVLVAGLLVVGCLLAWKFGVVPVNPWQPRRKPTINLEHARKQFHLRREWLEAHFLTLASQSGSPRGLQWVDCDFDDAVSFARDRNTGRLRALVGVTISFEAVVGGGMEDNPNVSNLRAATAIFYLDGESWSTTGRAIFNLNLSKRSNALVRNSSTLSSRGRDYFRATRFCRG